MPNQRKIEQVKELSELFSSSDTIIMADYKGTSVSELSGLRRALNDTSAKFKIAKNTLAKLAAEQSSKDALSEEITGPLGFVLTNEDPYLVETAIWSLGKLKCNDVDIINQIYSSMLKITILILL